MKSYNSIFQPESGWAAFFTSILVWGIGVGCFQAAFNNFLVETYNIDGVDRGVLEFLREMPGVLLIAIFALLRKYTDLHIFRIGIVISLIAAGMLIIPVPWMGAVAFITVWALGEHLVMPVRQSIALSIAREGKSGESLGVMTSAINAGTVIGSLAVAAIFFAGTHLLGEGSHRSLYNIVWFCVMLLLAMGVILVSRMGNAGLPGRSRPSFYFRRKYSKFYALELFYGARKQVFFTFGPFVLIKVYGMATKDIALLFGISACLTAIWGGRLIGRLTDRWGYRNVMIWDTVILSVVCVLYGFANELFPPKVAIAVVCVNYILDAILSNASIATNLYARTLSDSQEELTATLSAGISVNHFITIFYAILGGWVFDRYGAGVLFASAAVLALANSAFALTVPKNTSKKIS